MNISYQWLRAIAPSIDASPAELADRLAMLGAPVDELVELGAGLGDVVIARVAEVRQHPNADRLRLCTVDAGGPEPLQVVCGAPNVTAGAFYPFAPIGASLPGGIEIRKAKLRGEVSEGMLCSARELGLGKDHEGLMTLSGAWETGASFVAQLGLDDVRMVVDVTPNRPDLLSHIGVARELAAEGVDGLTLPSLGEERATLEVIRCGGEGNVPGIRVVVEDPEACPRYMAAIVRGVRVAPSPEWLAARLRAIGLRPINNVVDATNYVLMELGQPLHAFDLDRLSGPEIRVRSARPGEPLRTLDGVERVLTADALVIADAERAVALAGVIGGEESAVTSETTDVLIECALFDPARVRRTARALGLSTDASYRYERGVDPELRPVSLQRVVDLILGVAGGTAEAQALDVAAEDFPRRVVTLRPERVTAVLGVPAGPEEIAGLLAPIGLTVRSGGGPLEVEVPGYRPDITREIDLIEEVARRRGYDSFPDALQPFRPTSVPEDALVAVARGVRDTLRRWGLLEARTAGFAPASDDRVPLLNPLSAEESHLRESLIPGLLRRVEHNWAHGVRSIRLFEIGTVFLPRRGEATPGEETRVAAAFTGPSEPLHWSEPARPWDVWDLKSLMADVAEVVGAGKPVPATGGDGAILDAGERLEVSVDGRAVGVGARVRPAAVDAPPWADALYVLEVTLRAPGARAHGVTALPGHPAIERDLALLVAHGTPASEVERVVNASGGALLEAVWPFDLYVGAGIPEDTRSLAWRLRFRAADRTLTDAEVDSAVSSILRALGDELNVVRR